MKEPTLTRRDLSRLALAALGGLASGALLGCGPGTTSGTPPAPSTPPGPGRRGGRPAPAETPLLLHDPHVCRGINTCKNKGKKDTTNDCAGQGHCATVKSHSCQGMNDCKGQGGCGDNPGENECKGKGGCGCPWTRARR